MWSFSENFWNIRRDFYKRAMKSLSPGKKRKLRRRVLKLYPYLNDPRNRDDIEFQEVYLLNKWNRQEFCKSSWEQKDDGTWWHHSTNTQLKGYFSENEAIWRLMGHYNRFSWESESHKWPIVQLTYIMGHR